MSGSPDPASLYAMLMSPTGTVFISAFVMSACAEVPVQPARAMRTASKRTAGTIMAKIFGFMNSPMKSCLPGFYKKMRDNTLSGSHTKEKV